MWLEETLKQFKRILLLISHSQVTITMEPCLCRSALHPSPHKHGTHTVGIAWEMSGMLPFIMMCLCRTL